MVIFNIAEFIGAVRSFEFHSIKINVILNNLSGVKYVTK